MPGPKIYLYGTYNVFSVQAELDDPCRSISVLTEVGASPQAARVSWDHSEEQAIALFHEALKDYNEGLGCNNDEPLNADEFELQITWGAPGDDVAPFTDVKQSWVYEWVHPYRPEYNGLADFMVVVQERSIASD